MRTLRKSENIRMRMKWGHEDGVRIPEWVFSGDGMEWGVSDEQWREG